MKGDKELASSSLDNDAMAQPQATTGRKKWPLPQNTLVACGWGLSFLIMWVLCS